MTDSWVRWPDSNAPILFFGLMLLVFVLAVIICAVQYWYASFLVRRWQRWCLCGLRFFMLLTLGLILFQPTWYSVQTKNRPYLEIIGQLPPSLLNELVRKGVDVKQIETTANWSQIRSLAKGPLLFSETDVPIDFRLHDDTFRSTSISFMQSRFDQLVEDHSPEALARTIQLYLPHEIQSGAVGQGMITVPPNSPTFNLTVMARLARPSTSDNREFPKQLLQTRIDGNTNSITFPLPFSAPGRVVIEVWAAQEQKDSKQTLVGSDTVLVTATRSRLLYVSSQPTWQLRFLKETLLRDATFSVDGIRIFLEGIEPETVRENRLYIGRLPATLAELLAYDIVLLDNIDTRVLSDDFLQLLKRFVSDHAGAVILSEGLPATPRPLGQSRRVSKFSPVAPVQIVGDRSQTVSAQTGSFPAFWDGFSTQQKNEIVSLFVNSNATLTQRLLPGSEPILYQTLARQDGGSESVPRMASRRYGLGQVIWLGTNETWRLRQTPHLFDHFWRQLLGAAMLNRQRGDSKRFTFLVDRRRADIGQTIHLEARCIEPSSQLSDELNVVVYQEIPDGDVKSQTVTLRRIANGTADHPTNVWRGSFRPTSGGICTLKLKHPARELWREAIVQVVPSTQRQSGASDAAQRIIAKQTRGKFIEADWPEQRILDSLLAVSRQYGTSETSLCELPLQNHSWWFGVMVTLLCTEWFLRRRFNLI